jgi:hypothetical protein
MNWSLVTKRQKTEEAETTSGEAKNVTAVAPRKARDARKSIAWFNHEYEEEESWDLETTATIDANGNNDTEEPAAGGLSKEQLLAMEDALRSVEDKLREEQIMRNQIERLLEEEKARASLELSKWQSEFALAQQQIDALVHEKNSLSSDLTVKNERLRSLNQNLMAKGSVAAAATSSSSSSGMQSSSKSKSSDSSDEEEFGDWDQVHKGFDNDDDYEPVSLRRLTMGVGLLRRANADAHGTAYSAGQLPPLRSVNSHDLCCRPQTSSWRGLPRSKRSAWAASAVMATLAMPTARTAAPPPPRRRRVTRRTSTKCVCSTWRGAWPRRRPRSSACKTSSTT